MVRHRRLAGRLLEQVVVPARPRAAAAREQGSIGVQDRLVGLVGDRAQQLVLAGRRVGEQLQRLVGVGGEDDLVEALGVVAARRDRDVVGVPGDLVDRSREAETVTPRRGQRLDVAVRAAGDRPPLRAVAEAEHPVVGEELDQEARGEAPHLARVGRPHRRGLGHDQAVDERARVPPLLQEVPERGAVAVGRQQRPRLSLEAQQVGDHAVEPRRREVRALGEQPVRRGARVLEVPAFVGDREAHVRGLAVDPEAVEQPLEARVVAVVEDDEAGVDPVRLVRRVDPHRVRVPARVGVGLEDGHLVLGREQVRGDQPGHAGADDGDPHDCGASTRRRMGNESAARAVLDHSAARVLGRALRPPGLSS